MTDFITTRLVKEELNYDESDQKLDKFLGRLVKVACQKVVEICQQPIVRETLTWEITARGGYTKQLGKHPITNLTALECLSNLADGYETIDPETYRLSCPRGVYRLISDTPFSNGGLYQITADVGYVLASVPETIRQVAIEMVMVMYKESDRDPEGGRLGVSTISTNAQATQLTTTRSFKKMMPEWRAALADYIALPE